MRKEYHIIIAVSTTNGLSLINPGAADHVRPLLRIVSDMIGDPVVNRAGTLQIVGAAGRDLIGQCANFGGDGLSRAGAQSGKQGVLARGTGGGHPRTIRAGSETPDRRLGAHRAGG